MDFGRVDSLEGIDFSLPNGFCGLKGTPADSFEVRIGLPIWANPAWHGKMYSATQKDDQGLPAYGRLFNTIELNVTHYQIPTPEMRRKWIQHTPDGFLFCSKFPQAITHERGLVGTHALTQLFIDYLEGMGNRVGPSFLQLPPTFGPRQADRLWGYLADWPKKYPLQIEFRHPDWFSSPKTWQQTCELLQTNQVGVVCTDVPGRRDVVHASVTHDTAFLRFVGQELHATDFLRSESWVYDKITHWRALGLKKIFIFIHSGDNAVAPELANFWINCCNKALNLAISGVPIRPQFIQGQLF